MMVYQMINKIYIYNSQNTIYTLVYDDSKQLIYQLIESEDTYNQGIFLGKVNQVYSKSRIAWVNYKDDLTGILNLTKQHLLQSGSNIACQMTWEGDEKKSPKFSHELKLTGKYVILVNSKNHFYAKGLLNNKRFDEISNKYKNYGLIFRSALNYLENLDFLEQEIKSLISVLNSIDDKIRNSSFNQQIYPGTPKYLTFLKNIIYSKELNIYTNCEKIYNNLQKYQELWQIFKINFDKNIDLKLVQNFDNQINNNGIFITFHKLSGINLIDIDSRNTNLNFYQVNYLAIDLIIQRIKLQDLCGIILIDFIKNMNLKQQVSIAEKINNLLCSNDWRKNEILGFTKSGIFEIIRKK